MRYERFAEDTFDIMGTSGQEVLALCPFHDDHRPSFYFNQNSGLWVCHACGAKGNIQTLKRAGYDPKPEVALHEIQHNLQSLKETPTREDHSFYPEGWLARFDNHTPYWAKRGFTRDMVKKFQLGFDPGTNSATIPIRNADGRILGVIRRSLAPMAKVRYMYPKGLKINELLFGSWLRPEGIVALTEGSLDAIKCWQAGVPAMAIYGARMSRKQGGLLRRLGVRTTVLMLDNDKAGKQGTDQVASMLRGLLVLKVSYAGVSAKDPGDLTEDDIHSLFLRAQDSTC
tara:strand:+ start:14310 stop:15164 length:855 start_codon:yes stop_codon:yes gene_type:complete